LREKRRKRLATRSLNPSQEPNPEGNRLIAPPMGEAGWVPDPQVTPVLTHYLFTPARALGNDQEQQHEHMSRIGEIEGGFRMRGKEVTRLEAFSDTVFGFAPTLLVVSLDAPRTFRDLTSAMRGFPAFAICFLFLALIWNGHYKFCRRYGLDDGMSRFLTCVMLFVVLFYVYPLKFLFTMSINSMLFGSSAFTSAAITKSQFANLMTIYGLGFAAVYFTLTMLYLHAWKLREQLELTAFEISETQYQIKRLLVLVSFGLLAAGLARFVQGSGLVYALIWPGMRILRAVHNRGVGKHKTGESPSIA
jgi:uncharacterized membrane protein